MKKDWQDIRHLVDNFNNIVNGCVYVPRLLRRIIFLELIIFVLNTYNVCIFLLTLDDNNPIRGQLAPQLMKEFDQNAADHSATPRRHRFGDRRGEGQDGVRGVRSGSGSHGGGTDVRGRLPLHDEDDLQLGI